MPEPLLSTADWFASLSTVYLSASMLITDQVDRVLLVKPNYRPDWGIPGGIVEADEAPDQCATREIAEELGLDIPAGDLLVVDWVAAAQDRPQDTVARLGGDEFAVTAPRINAAGLDRLSGRVRSALSQPHLIHGHLVPVPVSIGIHLAAPGESADAALREADRAMYAAKRRTR